MSGYTQEVYESIQIQDMRFQYTKNGRNKDKLRMRIRQNNKRNGNLQYMGRFGKKYKNCRKIDWIPKTCSEETIDNKLNYGVNKMKK